MLGHLRGNLWLLALSLLVCCVLYPLTVLGIAKVFFPHQAEGDLLDQKGQPVTDAAQAVGSRLIAQPFSGDEYFQPRPSAVSYNAAASGASNWAANNYLLRDRVARQLGPLVKYASGSKRGRLVAPDIESWFQKDQFAGKPGIVAQWASLHSGVAGPWLHDWVKADKLNAAYVAVWEVANPAEVNKWKGENNPDPKPEDLAAGIAGAFFTDFSKDHPGSFPGIAEYEKDGKTAKTIGPVKKGNDIQSLFFDMWLTDHADADLVNVPADMVMASGSGLDPHITYKNAIWQFENSSIVDAWAKSSGVARATVRRDIGKLLQDSKWAPLGGRIGEPLINVLEVNLALEDHFHKPAAGK